MHRERVGKQRHRRQLLLKHLRVAGLTQQAQMGDAELERILKRARLALAIHVSNNISTDGVEALEVAEADLGEVAANADFRGQSALDELRINPFGSVRHAEDLAIL